MPSMSITVFMIRKAAYNEFNRFLGSLGRGVPTTGDISGTFYAIPSEPKQPGWVVALSGTYLPHAATAELFSQSPAGLLICRENSKLLAISFGHAWMKLKSEWLDHDFGRRVALNSIAAVDLRQLRSEQVLANRHRSIERSPDGASLNDFSYESDRDLVFSVEGISRKLPFTGTVRGGAPLRFDIEVEQLRKAIHATTKRLGYGYQEKFPDIDSLMPVTLKDHITSLDSRLDEEISTGNTERRVGLTPPASLEVFDQDLYFSYGRFNPTKHARSWALLYQEWVASLKGENPTLAVAERSVFHAIDAASGIRKTSIKIRDALSFDFVRPDGHYVIFSGKWYKASPNLLLKISVFLANMTASEFPPPTWNGIEREVEYNQRACNENTTLVHMDARHIFYGGGQSKFEFCDFLDPTNRVLYFVKNPNSATGMSHLYEQVRRTTELFFGNNPDYIERLRIALLRHRPGIDITWLQTPPRGPDWEVCLVSMGKEAAELPLFAKCGLMRVYRELSGRHRTISFCAA